MATSHKTVQIVGYPIQGAGADPVVELNLFYPYVIGGNAEAQSALLVASIIAAVEALDGVESTVSVQTDEVTTVL